MLLTQAVVPPAGGERGAVSAEPGRCSGGGEGFHRQRVSTSCSTAEVSHGKESLSFHRRLPAASCVNGNTPGLSLQTHLFDQSKCIKLPNS